MTEETKQIMDKAAHDDQTGLAWERLREQVREARAGKGVPKRIKKFHKKSKTAMLGMLDQLQAQECWRLLKVRQGYGCVSLEWDSPGAIIPLRCGLYEGGYRVTMHHPILNHMKHLPMMILFRLPLPLDKKDLAATFILVNICLLFPNNEERE